MHKVGKILTKIEGFFNVLAGVAIVGMMSIITLDTIMRYFFKRPISGVEEVVSCYLSIVLVYLSISYCYRVGGHVRVTALEEKLPKGFIRVINSIMGLAAFAFFSIIAYANILTMEKAYTRHSVPGGVVNTPIWPGYLVLVIGAILMAIRLLLNSILVIAGKQDEYITPGGVK